MYVLSETGRRPLDLRGVVSAGCAMLSTMLTSRPRLYTHCILPNRPIDRLTRAIERSAAAGVIHHSPPLQSHRVHAAFAHPGLDEALQVKSHPRPHRQRRPAAGPPRARQPPVVSIRFGRPFLTFCLGRQSSSCVCALSTARTGRWHIGQSSA